MLTITWPPPRLSAARWRACSTMIQRIALAEAAKKWLRRSEEHTSELQSLMRISYAVFCLKQKQKKNLTECRIHTAMEHKYIGKMRTNAEAETDAEPIQTMIQRKPV